MRRVLSIGGAGGGGCVDKYGMAVMLHPWRYALSLHRNGGVFAVL
jgi:hypothetical protein